MTQSKKPTPPPRDKEAARSSKQVARHVRLGGEAGGLALRLLLARLSGRDTEHNAQEIQRTLGTLKGPLVKIAQILATVPDALPPEYAEALRELQSNAPPMGAWFVKRRMRSELGADWESKFDSFTLEPAAAASLGQVHYAQAHGRALAVKLQYPDMESAVAADLAQMRLALATYRRWDSTIDARRMLGELEARLGEELDYEREAAHQKLFATLFNKNAQENTSIVVPQPYFELSTRRLLTMSRIDGIPLVEWLKTAPSQADRNHLATLLLRAWYMPFYRHGILHGDPHLGNYTVKHNPSGSGNNKGKDGQPILNLLDYGCVRIFPKRFVRGVLDLYRATRDHDNTAAISAYEAWGFEGIADRPELLAALNIWAEFIYGPQLQDKVQPIVQGSVAAEGGTVAAQVYRAIKEAGGVAPPGEFVLMDRSAVGLASVFSRLGAELNWARELGALAQEFDEPSFDKRQADLLRSVGLVPPPPPSLTLALA